MRLTNTIVGLIVALLLPACSSSGTRSYSSANVQSQTVYTAPAVRSALDGTTEAPGTQEIFGVYIPLVGTGLSLRGGLLWDGAGGGPITIPIGGQAETQAAEGCEPAGRWVTETRRVWVED